MSTFDESIGEEPLGEELTPDLDDDILEVLPETAGLVIAIDGPAGSGKSTVARRVADVLGLPHVDTGALYRTAALACLRAGVELADADAVGRVVDRHDIAIVDGRANLDGEDVEDEIRGGPVTAAVSRVSAHASVRQALTPAQRAAVEDDGGVVEGRDIGTVVLPDADLKVFLTATVEERARRRTHQLGRDDLDVVTSQMLERDALDAGRALAPLAQAEDAWVLDTTGLEVADVVDAIVDRVTRGEGEERATSVALDPIAARKALPRVAVVGRPNVGKSTLVNRILGERIAIVEEKPGVTRDRTEHLAEWLGTRFLIYDTGGWEHAAEGMAARIVEQAEAAIADADVVLFVVDATIGTLEDDERYAKLLRRGDAPVVLVANKIDSTTHEPLVHELYGLGLGTPWPVSARHGRGIGDLLDEVLDELPKRQVPDDLPPVPAVAIVGKPNVGKSSLFNRLLGEERSIVDAVPHTTRDAVDTMVEIDGEPWTFVDTAGMRRRYRHGEDTELYSVDRTRLAVDQAELVLFVVDASEPLGEQDQRLAALLRDAGRGVILICNKWDLVDDDRRAMFERELDRLLGFASFAPRVNVSALSGRGLRRIMPTLRAVWGAYNRRIPTRELNRLLTQATSEHMPPRVGNRQLKVRYGTQAEVAPPRIVLFTNGRLPEGYQRYLERRVRETYDFTGVPIVFDDRPPARRARDARRGRLARRR